MRNVSSLEAVYQDYAPKGVDFYYIYKALAHPELDGYVTPYTLKERLDHVKEAKRRLGSKIPWICDNMANDLKHALGNASNSEFIVDPDGRIMQRRMWSSPDGLRRDLEMLIGPVEKPTLPSEVNIESEPPPKGVAKGVVPRVERPAGAQPLKIEPNLTMSDAPYYAKLRAEIERGFQESGKGKLYLRFQLDPLYRVHWNNKVKPIRFEVETPDGINVSPDSGEGPEVEADADADPREFLLDVTIDGSKGPFKLKVYYFACDDDQTFCVPVTQEYAIRLETDPDGGWVMGGGGGRRGRWGGGRGNFMARIMENDKDGDGKISQEEAPERMRDRFQWFDADGDGFIEQKELDSMRERFRQRFRGGGPPRDQEPATPQA
jgi:hypothetical protein